MSLTRNLAWGAAGAAALGWGAQTWLRSRRRIDLADRVILVTGASTGLGFLCAQEAARQGAKLVLAARSGDTLAQAAAIVERLGARGVHSVPTDVTNPEQAESLVRSAVERFGRVDVLLNNAGTIRVGPLEAMTLDDFREVMALNFWACLYMTQAVLPTMRAQGFGRIGNIVSVGGRFAMPHMLPYTTSKFALTGLTRGLRAELAKDNILVSGIYPGTIRTGGHTNAYFKGDQESEYVWFALADTLPLMSTSAHYAARCVWDAIRHGDAETVVGWNARLAVIAQGLFPNWTAEALDLVNRTILPEPGNLSAPARQGEELEGMIPDVLNQAVPRDARPDQELEAYSTDLGQAPASVPQAAWMSAPPE